MIVRPPRNKQNEQNDERKASQDANAQSPFNYSIGHWSSLWNFSKITTCNKLGRGFNIASNSFMRRTYPPRRTSKRRLLPHLARAALESGIVDPSLHPKRCGKDAAIGGTVESRGGH